MNGCHIAIYCMAIVGKSLKVIGSYNGLTIAKAGAVMVVHILKGKFYLITT